jgi:hypothetical protein
MRIKIEVEVDHQSGKFASKDHIGEILCDVLGEYNDGEITTDEEAVYLVASAAVVD